MKRILAALMCLFLFCAMSGFAEMEIILDAQVSETPIEQKTSLTTGLPTKKDDKIMLIQMDNEPGARPQKGIASADIMYEVEIYAGGYTRYTGVFNDTIPEEVEAIRSTRKVHIDLSKEYGGVFVHYGLGEGVWDYLQSGVKPEIRYNGIAGIKGFYRDNSRKAPNNVVCQAKDLYNRTYWSKTTAKSPLKFSETNYTKQGEAGTKLSLNYRSGYQPSFEYQNGRYYRYYNGDPHKDGATGKHLSYDNIIVQHVRQTWKDGVIPLVELFGTNQCDYFIDGKHFTGYSERANVNENTRYYDDNGNEVIFKPGKTFIQLFKTGRQMSINGIAVVNEELCHGSSGDAVRQLQKKLAEMGLLNGKVDGIFGSLTEAAVIAAQKKLGVEQTGVATPDFLKALYAQ